MRIDEGGYSARPVWSMVMEGLQKGYRVVLIPETETVEDVRNRFEPHVKKIHNMRIINISKDNYNMET